MAISAAHSATPGRYELELPSGIHRIVATAPGYRESPQTVVVEDEPEEAQRLTLIPAS